MKRSERLASPLTRLHEALATLIGWSPGHQIVQFKPPSVEKRLPRSRKRKRKCNGADQEKGEENQRDCLRLDELNEDILNMILKYLTPYDIMNYAEVDTSSYAMFGPDGSWWNERMSTLQKSANENEVLCSTALASAAHLKERFVVPAGCDHHMKTANAMVFNPKLCHSCLIERREPLHLTSSQRKKIRNDPKRKMHGYESSILLVLCASCDAGQMVDEAEVHELLKGQAVEKFGILPRQVFKPLFEALPRANQRYHRDTCLKLYKDTVDVSKFVKGNTGALEAWFELLQEENRARVQVGTAIGRFFKDRQQVTAELNPASPRQLLVQYTSKLRADRAKYLSTPSATLESMVNALLIAQVHGRLQQPTKLLEFTTLILHGMQAIELCVFPNVILYGTDKEALAKDALMGTWEMLGSIKKVSQRDDPLRCGLVFVGQNHINWDEVMEIQMQVRLEDRGMTQGPSQHMHSRDGILGETFREMERVHASEQSNTHANRTYLGLNLRGHQPDPTSLAPWHELRLLAGLPDFTSQSQYRSRKRYGDTTGWRLLGGWEDED